MNGWHAFVAPLPEDVFSLGQVPAILSRSEIDEPVALRSWSGREITIEGALVVDSRVLWIPAGALGPLRDALDRVLPDNDGPSDAVLLESAQFGLSEALAALFEADEALGRVLEITEGHRFGEGSYDARLDDVFEVTKPALDHVRKVLP